MPLKAPEALAEAHRLRLGWALFGIAPQQEANDAGQTWVPGGIGIGSWITLGGGGRHDWVYFNAKDSKEAVC